MMMHSSGALGAAASTYIICLLWPVFDEVIKSFNGSRGDRVDLTNIFWSVCFTWDITRNQEEASDTRIAIIQFNQFTPCEDCF